MVKLFLAKWRSNLTHEPLWYYLATSIEANAANKLNGLNEFLGPF